MYLVKINTKIEGRRKAESLLINCADFEGIAGKVANSKACYEYEIISAKKVKCEVTGYNGEAFFSFKYKIITIDEVTAKERKQTAEIVINADTMEEADSLFNNWIKGGVSDIEIVSKKATNITDYIV